MSKKTSANVMKIMGASLAICSAAALVSSTKSNSMNAKKAVKKTADRVVDFVDTVASFM